jgi:predicted methyltransferase
MMPIVHGLETRLGAQVTVLYFDISDPATAGARKALGFQSTPHFFLVDAAGKVLGDQRGVIAGKEFEQWVIAAMPPGPAEADRSSPIAPQRPDRSSGGEHPPRQAREIELAVTALELAPGDAVAEIGAGDARFSFRFADIVGPQGRVYANELGASSVRRITQEVERRQLPMVVAVEGAADQTNLPDGCCDAMMMRHVYHMLTQPQPMAASFFRALKPGGLLLILEGDPQPGRRNAAGVPANRAGMGIDPQIVIEELSAAGFTFDRRVPDWAGSDYALVFRKPAQ